jgi:predicted nucleotide-binding protein
MPKRTRLRSKFDDDAPPLTRRGVLQGLEELLERCRSLRVVIPGLPPRPGASRAERLSEAQSRYNWALTEFHDFDYEARTLLGYISSEMVEQFELIEANESINDVQYDVAESVEKACKRAGRAVLERVIFLASVLREFRTARERSASRPRGARSVFIVHGHDEAMKEAVTRVLRRMNLTPILLQDAPDRGRTIIEKFLASSDVGFAVVLFSPDDVGGMNAGRHGLGLTPRARQNVVFELGFFVGKLGRHRVCVLSKPGVEILSDYHGVLFVPFDDSRKWVSRLKNELRAAGVPGLPRPGASAKGIRGMGLR